jgi:hypothetical protein
MSTHGDITKGISLKVCKFFKLLAIFEIKGTKHFFYHHHIIVLSTKLSFLNLNHRFFPSSFQWCLWWICFHLLFNDINFFCKFRFLLFLFYLTSLLPCFLHHNLLFIGLCSSHISFHSSFELVVMFSCMKICYSWEFVLCITILIII